MSDKDNIALGDRIAYSADFLRSIGCYAGDMPAGRGIVKSLKQIGSMTLAHIEWEGDAELPQTINVNNIAKVGGRGFSSI